MKHIMSKKRRTTPADDFVRQCMPELLDPSVLQERTPSGPLSCAVAQHSNFTLRFGERIIFTGRENP